ncbi:addiction module protein [Occultella kanbiaonis]|uniref:addiction module protein n=1 Tax=Occultella kanbiaonis TaxID=2675754 RepID=UPI0039A5445D
MHRDADVDQSEINAAWEEVIDRRAEDILSDRTKFVDGRGAHTRVRAGQVPELFLPGAVLPGGDRDVQLLGQPAVGRRVRGSEPMSVTAA